MSKVKVKKVKLSSKIKDEGLAEMFNQMLGTGSINMPISYGRYCRMRDICGQIIQVIDLLNKTSFMRHHELEHNRCEIEKFISDNKIGDLFTIDLTDRDINNQDDDTKAIFAAEYERVKSSNLISIFIKICDNLIIYKKNFMDLDKLNHKFVAAMPGSEWRPFPFTSLNIKYAFTFVGKNAIAVILTAIGKIYQLTKELHDELQSPDIDVDKFISVIMNNIDEIQKHPKLNRCKAAFVKIKESVALLKDRFNGYYKDFIQTKDSTIMMQHFIIDVSKSTNADPVVIAQFRTIISYYRELAQHQITNPKFKILFDRVSDSFHELENSEAEVNITDDQGASDIEDTITAAAVRHDDLVT